MKDKKLRKSDIMQIVQLFDMDGAYVPNHAIALGENYSFVYSTTCIQCIDPQRVVERNRQKREILDYLRKASEICKIPYEMYYMSCNLDHALYDQLNLDKELKQEYADAFYEKFLGREHTFINFLKEEVVNGVPDSFTGSWRYICEGLHSLERHTICIFIFHNIQLLTVFGDFMVSTRSPRCVGGLHLRQSCGTMALL